MHIHAVCTRMLSTRRVRSALTQWAHTAVCAALIASMGV